MGAQLSKAEVILLERSLKEGKIHPRVKGRCRICTGPLKEMRFRGQPVVHCRCGYKWA